MTVATTADTYSARNTEALELYLELDEIRPSALNPRKLFDQGALEELAASIREHGLLEPLIVRDTSTGYELIAGERRWRACRMAGIERVPARILEDIDDDRALRLMLVENLQRQDLDPIEEARGYAQLNHMCGLKQREIAEAVHRSQPSIANRMRLLELPEDVQKRISDGELTAAHGIVLASVKEFPKVASKIAEDAVKNKITTKTLEDDIFYSAADKLSRDGAIARIEHAIQDACKEKCPHGAYRYSPRNYNHYCLRPECHKQTVEELAKARAQRMQEAVEQAQAGGGAIVKLKDLPYDSYHSLRLDNTPAGCKGEACEKCGQGLGWDDKIERICTDVHCWNTLKQNQGKQEAKIRKEAHKVAIELIQTAIDGLTEIGPREWAVISEQAGSYGSISIPVMRTALERHGVGHLMPKREDHGPGIKPDLNALETIPAPQVWKVTLEAIFMEEIAGHFAPGYDYKATSTCDWYFGRPMDPTKVRRTEASA